jgi:hypothetical protein
VHFVNNDEIEIFEGNKELLRIYPILKHLKGNFNNLYKLKEKYPLMGQTGIQSAHFFTAAKFGIKSFKHCASSIGYL